MFGVTFLSVNIWRLIILFNFYCCRYCTFFFLLIVLYQLINNFILFYTIKYVLIQFYKSVFSIQINMVLSLNHGHFQYFYICLFYFKTHGNTNYSKILFNKFLFLLKKKKHFRKVKNISFTTKFD